MEIKKINSIVIPQKIKFGISPYKAKYTKITVAGIDTETVQGKLFSLQIVLDNDKAYFKIAKDMNSEDILDFIFSVIPNGTTIFFSHNLGFELSSLFPDLIQENITEVGDFKVQIIHPSPCWMKVSTVDRSMQKNIQMIDTMGFFKGSLAAVAEKFNIEVKKMEHPSYLGEREPTEEELPYFKDYAMTDASVARLLGIEISNMHREYEISISRTVSPATFSSKVFRKHYVNYIPYHRSIVNKLALLSYHGGRTESLVYGTTKCKIYDFNSHYPFACTQIPIPTDVTKWKYVREFDGEAGFYRISGNISPKKISPLPFRYKRLMFPVGRFKNIFVTGYEAKHILDCANIDRIKGYVYKGESDDCLKNFVEDFYKKKNESVDNPVQYLFNKLLLNSIYGKYLQMNPIDKFPRNVSFFNFDLKKMKSHKIIDNRKFKASGMFNPVIASWITGFARAKLYDTMNEYEEDVYYVDTDSVAVKPHCHLPSSNRLGDLKLEKEGMMTILREKLYLMMDNDKVVKSATHGFWKRGDDLWAMISEGRTNYSVKHMVKIKEAIRQHKQALVFETQDRCISLAPSQKRQVPEDWRKLDFLHDMIQLPALELPLELKQK